MQGHPVRAHLWFCFTRKRVKKTKGDVFVTVPLQSRDVTQRAELIVTLKARVIEQF